MSGAAATRQHDAPQALLLALASAALRHFAALRLADPAQVDNHLDAPPLDWQREGIPALRELRQSPGVIPQLLRDFQLGEAEALLFVLCGTAEDHHGINLALATLQDGSSPRPQLHLCQALTESLFDTAAVTPTHLVGHPLVELGMWRLDGDSALPTRQLAMDPRLWAVLNGRPVTWPGIQALHRTRGQLFTDELEQRLLRAAELLGNGDAEGVAVRGSQRAAEELAARLAAQLHLTPVAVSDDAWRDPLLPVVSRYSRLLPVLRPQHDAGQTIELTRSAGPAGPVAVLLGPQAAVRGLDLVDLEIPPLPRRERQRLWQRQLPGWPDGDLPAIDSLMLDGPTLADMAHQTALLAGQDGARPGITQLRRARLLAAGDGLRSLAQPVASDIPADAVVYAPKLARELDRVVERCRRRDRIWEDLGATMASTPSFGVRALFVGQSGTGKTLAASHIATRLGAPLYRLDIAATLNKYIGETEKNLGLLLDAAAAQDAILLLDEADSLLGKRTDGGETGERFGNMVTNFLLTRLENHPGIVLMTSNSQRRIDGAFMRRLDYVIEFPAPGSEERCQLWRKHLGSSAPDALCRLLGTYCDLSGGGIRNAVLYAAAGQAELDRALLLDGILAEYRKLGANPPAQLGQALADFAEANPS